MGLKAVATSAGGGGGGGVPSVNGITDAVTIEDGDGSTVQTTGSAISVDVDNAETLANLAAEEAEKGTNTVIDGGNITAFLDITIDPGVTELAGGVFGYQLISAGTSGVENFSDDSGGIGATQVLKFETVTSGGDQPTISNPSKYSLGSDSVTQIQFSAQNDTLYSIFNSTTVKWEIDKTRTTDGVVTSTALAPVAVTVGASPYKYTNDSAYNQQVIIGNVAGLSAVKFQRGAGTQYAMGLLAQQVILCPGDNVEVTYAVTTPTMIAVTFRS